MYIIPTFKNNDLKKLSANTIFRFQILKQMPYFSTFFRVSNFETHNKH